ncbi:MAG: hypothetical protein NWS46_02875, partial [Cyclobacteriaceae bacterium]|nr:hypothetical protein [Cyclobacteriaceae bacterium]
MAKTAEPIEKIRNKDSNLRYLFLNKSINLTGFTLSSFLILVDTSILNSFIIQMVKIRTPKDAPVAINKRSFVLSIKPNSVITGIEKKARIVAV